jgi:hypothetical protein
MTCPHCREAAKFKEYRGKGVVSLLGNLRVSRGYYHCRSCHRGHFPRDAALRLSNRGLTPGAEEIVSLAGTQEAFGEVAERMLKKFCGQGLILSESTVQRTTEDAGRRVEKRLAAREVFGPRRSWSWHRDATGKTCGYISVDATGVMMQGANGAKADGRMAYVAMVFNPQPRRADDEVLSKPCDGVRYLAGHYTLAELGQQLRCQADHVGLEDAEQWVALTDGGNGLEHWIDVYFPRAAKVLDFRHAVGYLSDLAKALGQEKESETALTTWCHTLKHEGGNAMLRVLESLDRRRMSHAAKEQHTRTTNYIRNNVERMNYPEYLRRGWQIASGAVESACKTVVNQRLCAGGMRWSESGSDSVCHLRALFRSDPSQWDAFWNTPRDDKPTAIAA